MPDILLCRIDKTMAEHIKTLAHEHNGSINKVLLPALRQGLARSSANPFPEHSIDPVRAGAHLDDTEARVSDAASRAIAEGPDGQFAPKRDGSIWLGCRVDGPELSGAVGAGYRRQVARQSS